MLVDQHMIERTLLPELFPPQLTRFTYHNSLLWGCRPGLRDDAVSDLVTDEILRHLLFIKQTIVPNVAQHMEDLRRE